MKTLTLCADDFGMNRAISDGILSLIEQGRLSATTCMSNAPDWQRAGELLKKYDGKIDIGLHFNLGHAPMPLTLLRGYTRTLCPRAVEKALVAQLALFKAVMGRYPDFIDGHEHIHQFPVLREVLLKVYARVYPEKAAYIRNTCNNQPELKATIIQTLGGRALLKKLQQQGIPHNQQFSGIYNFADAKNYRAHFQAFLRGLSGDALIMCHPGFSDDAASSRVLEYQYFASDALVEDLQRAGFMINSHERPHDLH